MRLKFDTLILSNFRGIRDLGRGFHNDSAAISSVLLWVQVDFNPPFDRVIKL